MDESILISMLISEDNVDFAVDLIKAYIANKEIEVLNKLKLHFEKYAVHQYQNSISDKKYVEIRDEVLRFFYK